jgi:hypothetical protein
MKKLQSYADVVATLNAFIKNRKPPVALARSPHKDFWTGLSAEQFLTGFVPGVSDDQGQPLRIALPGNGEGSAIIQALRGTKGSLFDPDTGIYPRMPADGGPYLDDESIDAISQWIADQEPAAILPQEFAARGVRTPSYTQAVGLEFWYQFDLATKYNPALMPVLQAADAFGIQAHYHAARRDGKYPQAFVDYVAPRVEPWRQLASIQRDIFNRYLGTNVDDIRLALEDFGQGVLLDSHPDRIENGDAVHMMDLGGAPPVGFHRWHASIRAIQTFDQDGWWVMLDSLVALSWAIQSLARPKQGSVANNPLPAEKLQQLRDAWLPLAPDQIDKQYDLGTGVSGYHPKPLQPE